MVYARLLSLLVVATGSVASAQNTPVWPQWRGPDRDGIIRNQPAWPNNFEGIKEEWRINDLGPSYSGPIVTSELVLTTETVNKSQEVVTAFDRKTGKKIWTASWSGSMEVPFFAARNGSWIRATPAVDSERLYVAGMRDVLVALDLKTGKEIWRLDFTERFSTPLPQFGFVCSPLVDADSVYVQAGASFVRVDKATGKVIWRTLQDSGGMMGSAFSSPIVAKLGDVEQIVVQTRSDLAGVNRETGAVMWKKAIPSFRGMNILTPQPLSNNRIFTSTYGGTTQVFEIKTADKVQSIQDGWSQKYEGHMTSPVVIDGHAYLLGKDRRFISFDVNAGKENWRSDKLFSDYCSMIGNGDKILALDSKGSLYLLKANPKEFEILAEKKIAKSETWSHIAVAGSEMIIRDLNGLSMYRWEATAK